MEEHDKEVLSYFYRKVKARIAQMAREEIRTAEYNARHLAGGLGLEAELAFFQDLHRRRMEEARTSSGHYHVPQRFTKKGLREREFDTPSIRENRREVYESPHQERKDEFIDSIARGYYSLDVFEYLKERIIALQEEITPNRARAAQPQGQASTAAGKSRKGRDQTTSLQWLKEGKDPDGSKREKRLQHLHYSLQKHHLIGPIAFGTFKNHFSGQTQDKLINWTAHQYLLDYLLERIQPFMDPDLYKPKKASPTTLSKHFLFENRPMNKGSYRVMRVKKERFYKKKDMERIDLIISNISNI